MDEFLAFIVVGIIFLSVIVGVIALGVAIGIHLVDPVGELPGWVGHQIGELLRWVGHQIGELLHWLDDVAS